MLSRLGGDSIEGIYEGCSGHLNEKGYRMLAEVVAAEVKRSVAGPSGDPPR